MARLAIRMPKMSMTMTEGEVGSWMVEVGGEVAEGDVVCEVMTDKVEMEVESTVTGTLVEIAVASGMAQVGEPIGWVEGEDTGGGFGDLLAEPDAEAPTEKAAEPPVEAAADAGPDATPEPGTEPSAERAPEPEPSAQRAPAPAPDPTPDPVPEPRNGPVAAVPRARGLAAERGIDLATVTGTGPDGLIRVGDIEALGSPEASAPAQQPAVQPSAPAAPAQPAQAASGAARPDRARAVRLAVARAMAPTAQIPQFTVWRQVHLDAADVVRRGVSWTTVLMRAYAAALREVPELLSRWEDDGPAPSGPPCIALAVATDRGLLVPTFPEPDLGSPQEVDQQVRAVIRQAQTGKLDRANLGLANASLSNLGGLGVDRFQALLTPPQASVLSLGTVAPRPVAVPGGLGVALSVEAGLTVDHRVADGAHAARLLDRLARALSAGG